MVLDSESEDSDSTDDLQIDYLYTAGPTSSIEVEEPVAIKKVACNPHQVGYVLCGDNIDKNVKRRYQRFDQRTISLHYFHMYAAKNRVDLSQASDKGPTFSLSENAKAKSIMPSIEDDSQLKENITTLISRVLIDNMEFFKFCFSDVTCQHIKHKYYKEMSAKSIVVSTYQVFIKMHFSNDLYNYCRYHLEFFH